ncbi:MAG: RagB/SusD family nutrient uptake outer membrane protein [Chitinophagaceae bacterium]|nr:MAG: RagB/SusD family nutrient uptake outer membrane protein [Chitinophagaceae bacterium]
MKNIRYLFIGIPIIIILSAQVSCNKEFLNKTDPTRLGVNTFYQNQTEVDQALVGIYGQLRAIITNQWRFNELTSDNTTIDFNPSDRGQASDIEQFEYWQYTSSNPSINTMYDQYYNTLYNINLTLSKLPSANISDSAKNVVKGQLEFLRAYYYYNLTMYFGDVILITQPLNDPSQAWNFERKPQDSIFVQVQSDLKDAASSLPVRYNAANVGRITKGAALSLLGKVYLTMKDYADAVSTLRQVLNLGYALLPSYAAVFDPANKNSVESVFEVQFQGGNTLGIASNFIYTFAPRLSGALATGFPQATPGGWNIPTKNMIAAYEHGDLRKAASIGLDFVSPVTGEVVPYIKKYDHPSSIFGQSNDDWPVIRYSDVLLMLSEAINELNGPTDEAYTYLNQVRNRAGLNSLSGLNQSSFRDTVYHERRVELAFENDRWFFLKRTMSPDQLTSFLNAYGAEEKSDPTTSRQGVAYATSDYVFAPYKVVFPIPGNEIITNSKLKQNTGY